MITYRGEQFEGYNKPKRTPNHPTKSQALTRLLRVNPIFKLSDIPPQVLCPSGVPSIAGTAVQLLMPVYCI